MRRKAALEREDRKKQDEAEKIERERKMEEQSRMVKLSLPPEPEKSDKTTDLVIRFSDGSRICRRFQRTDPIEYVFMYVANKEIIDNKVLSTHYPRRIYTTKSSMTLQEAELYPQAAIFVEEPVVPQ